MAKNIKALVAPDVTAFKPAWVKSVSKVKLLPADPSDCVVVLLIELTVPKKPPAPEATVKPPDVVVEFDEKTNKSKDVLGEKYAAEWAAGT